MKIAILALLGVTILAFLIYDAWLSLKTRRDLRNDGFTEPDMYLRNAVFNIVMAVVLVVVFTAMIIVA